MVSIDQFMDHSSMMNIGGLLPNSILYRSLFTAPLSFGFLLKAATAPLSFGFPLKAATAATVAV